jgi:formamidopyrimidine-DNA glycosylase
LYRIVSHRNPNQTIFAGVGNIIKNEVLFRIRVHPLSTQSSVAPQRHLTMFVVNEHFSYYNRKKPEFRQFSIVVLKH